MFLIDTNVIAELARKQPHSGVVAWLRAVPNDQLYLAAVTLGELQAGVENLRKHDGARAATLEAWIDQLSFTWQVIDLDGRVFRTWARLMRGRSETLLVDGLIAATALVHRLTVATRNTRDFGAFNVPTSNPFAGP